MRTLAVKRLLPDRAVSDGRRRMMSGCRPRRSRCPPVPGS